jgi:hypothetical protein
MMNTKAKIQGARLKEGRKIDTWRFALPDDTSAEFTIHLIVSGDQMRFTAGSTHPLFRAIKLDDTDLEKLRDRLEDKFRDALEEHFGADWQPATMLEVSVRETDRNAGGHTEAEKSVTIKLRAVPLRLDATRPQGNLGETRVIMRESPQIVIQRARTDRFQVDKGLDSRNMRFHRENDDDLARVIMPDERDLVPDLDRLRETMARFGQNLADACSPQNIAMNGVPTPEDLVDIMQASAETEPEGPDHT